MEPYIPIPDEVAIPVYALMIAIPILVSLFVGVGEYRHQQYEEAQRRLEAQKNNTEYTGAKADKWNHLYTFMYAVGAVSTMLTVYVIMTCWFPQAADAGLTQYVSATTWISVILALVGTFLARITADGWLEAHVYKPIVEDGLKAAVDNVAPAVKDELIGALDNVLKTAKKL